MLIFEPSDNKFGISINSTETGLNEINLNKKRFKRNTNESVIEQINMISNKSDDFTSESYYETTDSTTLKHDKLIMQADYIYSTAAEANREETTFRATYPRLKTLPLLIAFKDSYSNDNVQMNVESYLFAIIGITIAALVLISTFSCCSRISNRMHFKRNSLKSSLL